MLDSDLVMYSKRHSWRYQQYYFAWNDFNTVLGALHRRTELEELIQWAARKRLSGPAKLYRSRHTDEETIIARVATRSPLLFFWARAGFHLNRVVSAKLQYKPKGSAARYRYKLA